MQGRYLFTATWCGPCKKIKASLKPDTDIRIVDIDEEPALAKTLGLKVVPQLITVKYGEIAEQLKGEFEIMQEL